MKLLLCAKDLVSSFVLQPRPSAAHHSPAQLLLPQHSPSQCSAACFRPAWVVPGQRCLSSHEQADSFLLTRPPAYMNSSPKQLSRLVFISPQVRRGLQGAKFLQAFSNPTQNVAPGGKGCHTISDPAWVVVIGSHLPTLQGIDCSGIAAESFWNN